MHMYISETSMKEQMKEDFATSDPAASSRLPSPTMDSIGQLLHLRQGGLTMEEYVHQFCELSYQVPLYDEYLFKDLFYFGLNSDIKAMFNKSLFSGGVYNGSLRGLLDYALLCAGSSFTVGVAEPAPEPAPSQELAESAPESAPEPAPSQEVAESPHVSADLPESPHVSADLPESRHATAVYPVSLHVSAVSSAPPWWAPVSLAPHGPGPPFPPPVPPPLHRPPELCRVCVKRLEAALWGGGLCHESGCLSPHYSCTSPMDYNSHHSLHYDTHISTIALITQLSPITNQP